MRRMVGDAGNIERLYHAVKNSAETPIDSEKYQWETFRRKYSGTPSSKFPTLESSRSAEPHIAFARELGLLEHRAAGGRWLLTPGAGRAFLELWDSEERRPPKHFLLAQLLRYDRALIIPFLEKFLDEGRDDGPVIIAKVWEELWRRHRNEMAALEPPVPVSLWHDRKRSLKRTAAHHFQARIRFLMKPEGLELNEDQTGRLVKAFWDTRESRMPSDVFFKIGWSIDQTSPQPITGSSLDKLAIHAYSRMHRTGYVSAQGAFGFINELALPSHAIGWDEFVSFLRTDDSITIHPSIHRDDLLYAPKAKQEVGSS